MTTEILTSPANILKHIKQAIAKAPARIAVPFWGRDALQALGLDKCDPNAVRILCNLSTGGCNPNVIRELMGLGFQVRALDSLHAKVYLGAKSAVLGSANASIDGLGLDEDNPGWDEACTRIDDPDAVKQLGDWFERLWKKAADLSKPQIAQLLLEQADRAPPALRVDPVDLLSTLKANPQVFASKSLYITLDYEPYSDLVTKRVKELQKELGSGIDAWEGWTTMPPAAEIISFYYETHTGETSFQGIYQSPQDPTAEMDPKTNGIFVTERRRALGAYAIGDEDAWAVALQQWAKAVFVGGKAKDEDLTLRLSDFASRYLEAAP